ncbi:MAG: hypothetical protein M3O46_19860 [Myxococcota bacterium]|nr:hypothetical protein [Myxococcota bacterium]
MHRVPFAIAIVATALQSALFFGCSAAPGASETPDAGAETFDGATCAPIPMLAYKCADAGASIHAWACPNNEVRGPTCAPVLFPVDPAHPAPFTLYCCEL